MYYIVLKATRNLSPLHVLHLTELTTQPGFPILLLSLTNKGYKKLEELTDLATDN